MFPDDDTPGCCDDPRNYTCEPNDFIDPDTGYREGDFWRCSCGNLIEDSDYGLLVQWFQNPVPEPDGVPAEIDERTRIEKKRIA